MFAVPIGSNLKDVIPVPPPRRKKRNRGRPLPPKPDEIPESVTNNLRRGDTCEEPLYLSVKSPKSADDRDDGDVETRGMGKICPEDPKHEGRRTKEIYEHKVSNSDRRDRQFSSLSKLFAAYVSLLSSLLLRLINNA